MVQLEVIPTASPITLRNIQENCLFPASISIREARSGKSMGLDDPLSGEGYDVNMHGQKFFIRRSVQSFEIESPMDVLRNEQLFEVDINSLTASWQAQGFSFMVSAIDKVDQFADNLTYLACAIARSSNGYIAFFSPFFEDKCPPGVYSEAAFFLGRGTGGVTDPTN